MISKETVMRAETFVVVEPWNWGHSKYRARMLKNRYGTLHVGKGLTVAEALCNLALEIAERDYGR